VDIYGHFFFLGHVIFCSSRKRFPCGGHHHAEFHNGLLDDRYVVSHQFYVVGKSKTKLPRFQSPDHVFSFCFFLGLADTSFS
jgi:hypothetical protein